MCAAGLGIAKGMMANKMGGQQKTGPLGNVAETGAEVGGASTQFAGTEGVVPKGQKMPLPEMIGQWKDTLQKKGINTSATPYSIPVGTAGSVPVVPGYQGQQFPIDQGYYQNPLNRQLGGY
jgi:hypothetical protein